ncbi:retron St85 family RNA-directed DNA polymerase [Streptococcus caprae]|uniref:RNA-directed DNA polymerase n=1 Tax=Streptococcus caprae TaxID=1640501 RepID=A0ABV8CYF9_9STRE
MTEEFDIPVFLTLEDLRKSIGINKKFFYSVLFDKKQFYKQARIPKKNGEYRTLNIPTLGLKSVQRWILDNILYKIPVEKEATGFVPQKSIVDNANLHLAKKYILKIDIINFFPSINFAMVRSVFIKYGILPEIATALANICTQNSELPQGSPTSPYLANIVCSTLDKRLSTLCKHNGLIYTRYADDITISGSRSFFWIKPLIEEIIISQGFSLNESKTIMLKPGDRKRVTGIIVNEKLSVPKSVTRNLRKNIYYIKKFGLGNHLEKTGLPLSEKQYKAHLYGIANFIKMVDLNKGLEFISQLDSVFSQVEEYNFLSTSLEKEFIWDENEWRIFKKT